MFRNLWKLQGWVRLQSYFETISLYTQFPPYSLKIQKQHPVFWGYVLQNWRLEIPTGKTTSKKLSTILSAAHSTHGWLDHSTFCISQVSLSELPVLISEVYKYSVITNNKKPTRCHLIFYFTYYSLNMFRALLCPSSWARDYDVVYHIGRVVLGLLYVRVEVQLGWSSVLQAQAVVLEPATRTPLQPNCNSPPTYRKPRTTRPMW